MISQTLLDNTAATAAVGCDGIDNSPVEAGKCRRIQLPLPFLGQGVQVAREAQGRTMDDSTSPQTLMVEELQLSEEMGRAT